MNWGWNPGMFGRRNHKNNSRHILRDGGSFRFLQAHCFSLCVWADVVFRAEELRVGGLKPADQEPLEIWQVMPFMQ